MADRLQLIINADRLLQAVQKAPVLLQKELGGEIATIIQLIARSAKRFAPKATSLLTNSIRAFKVSPLEGIVAPGVEYAPYVEDGLKPGTFPPVQNIEDWVKAVKITPAEGETPRDVAFKIARSIAIRGIKPQPFMDPALAEQQPDAERRINAAIDRALSAA